MLLFDIPGKIAEKIEKKKSPNAELRIMGFSLGGRWDSNPRPMVPQTTTLTD